MYVLLEPPQMTYLMSLLVDVPLTMAIYESPGRGRIPFLGIVRVFL